MTAALSLEYISYAWHSLRLKTQLPRQQCLSSAISQIKCDIHIRAYARYIISIHQLGIASPQDVTLTTQLAVVQTFPLLYNKSFALLGSRFFYFRRCHSYITPPRVASSLNSSKRGSRGYLHSTQPRHAGNRQSHYVDISSLDREAYHSLS